jgi:hypothetical protein
LNYYFNSNSLNIAWNSQNFFEINLSIQQIFLMVKSNNTISPDNRKLKFGEWRPIGVCDTAAPGKQKAQMFTREDFVIITAPGVDRGNWRQNKQVREVILNYVKKLERMSTLTKDMKKPVAKEIKLVGAIMKLAVTPNLNKESRDGKLQLFRVVFEDQGKKKTKKKATRFNLWILTISLLITILFGLVGAIGYKILNQKKRPTNYTFTVQKSMIDHCLQSTGADDYYNELEETWRILKARNDYGIRIGAINARQKCILKNASMKEKEEQIVTCYLTGLKYKGFSDLTYAEQRKISTCKQNLCRQSVTNRPVNCF